jgi:N-carbamoyl-L-amino-acid hydrolase
MVRVEAAFDAAWRGLAPIGRGPEGGYRRYSWTEADLACRAWFREHAESHRLTVEEDRNGNLWAWWGEPGPDAIVIGSHLDSVPDGGGYDGALGVVAALVAVGVLQERGVEPTRPVAVVAFAEEEGARFGIACLGTRLLLGDYSPDQARRLVDQDGVSLAEAMRAVGRDPARLGRDDELRNRIGVFLELHIEQGRGLIDIGQPVAVASNVWPHGRWRWTFSGVADHAGTTGLADRHDPMVVCASVITEARALAEKTGALATVGKVIAEPNGTNVIAAKVEAWLDVRAAELAVLEEFVAELTTVVEQTGRREGVEVAVERESFTPGAVFDSRLRERLLEVLRSQGLNPPLLGTGAGHDAAVLAAAVPTAMVFVRNPSGASHTPLEFAERADCIVGVEALTAVLADLLEAPR